MGAVVNLATNFSTKVPVWRPQFYARLRTKRYCNGDGERTTGFRKRNSKFENLSRNINLARPPPPPLENGSSFFCSFLNTSIIHETARPLTCNSVLFLTKTRSRTRFSSCDRRINSAVVERRDCRNGKSVQFRFRAQAERRKVSHAFPAQRTTKSVGGNHTLSAMIIFNPITWQEIWRILVRQR